MVKVLKKRNHMEISTHHKYDDIDNITKSLSKLNIDQNRLINQLYCRFLMYTIYYVKRYTITVDNITPKDLLGCTKIQLYQHLKNINPTKLAGLQISYAEQFNQNRSEDVCYVRNYFSYLNLKIEF